MDNFEEMEPPIAEVLKLKFQNLAAKHNVSISKETAWRLFRDFNIAVLEEVVRASGKKIALNGVGTFWIRLFNLRETPLTRKYEEEEVS